MNWIEKTLKELNDLVNVLPYSEFEEVFRKKLVESFKNGAQAERRKRFTPSDNRGKMKSYGKEKGDDKR